MKTRELNAAVAAANPIASGSLDGLDFEAMETELLVDIAAGGAPAPELGGCRSWGPPPRSTLARSSTSTRAAPATAR